jgi:hypothetical protein
MASGRKPSKVTIKTRSMGNVGADVGVGSGISVTGTACGVTGVRVAVGMTGAGSTVGSEAGAPHPSNRNAARVKIQNLLPYKPQNIPPSRQGRQENPPNNLNLGGLAFLAVKKSKSAFISQASAFSSRDVSPRQWQFHTLHPRVARHPYRDPSSGHVRGARRLRACHLQR